MTNAFPPGNPPTTTTFTPPKPPRRWLGRIFFILTILLLLVSIGGNVLLFFTVGVLSLSADSSNPSALVSEEKLQDGGREKIVILPAHGTVDDEMVQRIHRYIEFIEADKHIKAVIVEIDSPGGTITASDEIHHMLTQLGQKYPLFVSMRGLAASGGYYIAMPARTIYAQPTTITGSIGVIWPAFELSELLKKVGVTPQIITSDLATYKDAASPFKKFTEEDIRYIKGLVNHAHAKFSAVVEAGRHGKLKEPINKIAIGRVWTADDALSMGLIDEIAYMDEVWTKTASAVSLTNPTVVRLKDKHGLFELLGASSGMTSPKIEINPKMIYELQTPRMEYRYIPPQVMGQY